MTKKSISNNKAYISVTCLFIGKFILVFTMAIYNICIVDYQMVSSNADAMRANYSSETAVDEAIIDIYEHMDAIIMNYLEDLREYKINYIESLSILGIEPDYSPPNFDSYLKRDFINKISNLNKIVKNPFLGYIKEHEYSINIKYEKTEDVIYITGFGSYDNARKRIKAKVSMPRVVVIGHDAFGLEEIEIYPMEVISYFQEIFY